MKSFWRERVVVLVMISIAAGVFEFLPSPAHGAEASLYITPATGRRNVGERFQLAVRVNTGGAAINAAEGSIVFNSQKVEIISISKSGSVFTLWTGEPIFSNADGTITFSGGLPSPGYTGSSGLLFTITLRGKSATTLTNSTSVALVSGAILANDGYGTNILTSLGRSSFFIAPNGTGEPLPQDLPDVEEDSPPAGLGRPAMSSKTHPDQSKWYSNNVPVLSWALPSGVTEVRLVLTQRPSSVPFVVYRPPIREKRLDPLDNGVWYLNAKFFSSGEESPTGSYKLQIDTTAPREFAIIREDEDDPTNPRPELLFSTTDTFSGIDHYDLEIDREKTTVTADAGRSTYVLPLQKPGERDVKVTAVDKAGNATSAALEIIVIPLEKPTIDAVTEKVKGGEPLKVEGHAPAGADVVVEILNRNAFGADVAASINPLVESVTVTADENGVWLATISDLRSGSYLVRAHVQDDRGAVSEDTDTVQVRVGSFWSSIGTFIRRLWEMLPSPTTLLILVLTLLFLALFGMTVEHFRRHGTPAFSKKSPPKLRQDEDAVLGKLGKLSKDIDDELALLKRVATSRTLYPEEKYLREKLNQYKKTLKLFGSKK